MINWMAVKKAADAPMQRPAMREYTSKPDSVFTDTEGYWSVQPNSIDNSGRYRFNFRQLFPNARFEGQSSASPNITRFSFPIKDLRGMFYNNQQRSKTDEQQAMDARWKAWYDAANHRQANRLDRLKRLGYIPPMMLPGTRHIDWTEFRHPDERVKVTAFPSGSEKQAFFEPTHNTVYIPYSGSQQKTQDVTRHELAHALTQGSDPDGADYYSMIKGIPGFFEGKRAASMGLPGSYELAPWEMARLVFLQKSMAANGQAKPFTNVNEWIDTNESLIKSGYPASDFTSLSQPGADRWGWLGDSSVSASMANTVRDIQKRMRSSNPYTRRKAKDQWSEFSRMMNSIIPQASLQRSNFSTTV